MRHLGNSLDCAVKLQNEGLMTEVGTGINNTRIDKDSEFPIPVYFLRRGRIQRGDFNTRRPGVMDTVSD